MTGGYAPQYMVHNGMMLDPSMPNANAAMMAGRPSEIRQQYENLRHAPGPNAAMPPSYSSPMAYGHPAPIHPPGLAQSVVSRGELPPEFVPAVHQEEPRKPSVSEQLKEQLLAQMQAKEDAEKEAEQQ